MPLVTTKGSGTVEGNYNTKTKVITLDLKWSLGNSGDTTLMRHIHKGAVGVGGPVVIPLKGLPSGATDQQFTFTSDPLQRKTQPASGSKKPAAALLSILILYYFFHA